MLTRLETNVDENLFQKSFFFSLQSVLNDVSIVWQVFSLPILEPMTPVRLNKIITVAMSSLYAAITVATVNSVVAITGTAQPKGTTPQVKDDETDSAASAIVQKSVSGDLVLWSHPLLHPCYLRIVTRFTYLYS